MRKSKGKSFLRPYLIKHRRIFLALLLGMAAVSGIQTLLPLFQQYAINNFILGKTLDSFAGFVALYAIVLVVQMILDYVGAFNCCRAEMYILRDLRTDAFNHLQTLSVSFYNRFSVGYLHARLMSDTNNISGTISWGVYQGVYHVIYIIGATVVMFTLNPLLALCTLAVVPIIVVISMLFNKKLTRLGRKVRETNSIITSDFNEGITGVETAKTLGIEQKLNEKLYTHSATMRKQSVRLGCQRAVFLSIFTFVSSAVLALVLYYGGKITEQGVILIGTLSVFMTYAQGISSPIQWLVEFLADLANVKVNVERLSDLANTTCEVTDAPEVIDKYGDCFNPKCENWEKLEGDIEFEDVTFKYPDGDEYVLSHFNLKVKKGSNVAIVGETGAGKSTLVNLVCRFFEPTEGRILIDGRDARERSIGWLHGNIGYVLQTPHLFSGTIRENLLYGKPDATDEQLDEAIKSVNAQKIIQRLEGGYDSQIGEGGNTLSMGEKQLLSFARAILVNPAIFILDEATSSIDTLTEKLIQDAIQKLMQGRTSFVIAHRLSTIRNADVILVVHDGKIVEQGTHDELMAKREVYFNLYLKQFREEQIKNSQIKN